MKKWLIYILIVMVMTIGGKVEAANMQAVSTNTPIIDTIEYKGEEKYYQFTVDKAGYFTLSFRKQDPTADVESGWEVELYDMNGNRLYRCYGVKTSLITHKFSFAKGTNLYIKISSLSSSDVGDNYVFSIDMVEDSSWEQEYNDGISTANTIYDNQTKRASLWHGDDDDYFTYVVDKQGYFDISFDKEDPTADMAAGMLVVLYDEAGNKIEATSFKSSGKTAVYNFVKGETIYIRVTGYSSYASENPTGLSYKLTINSKEESTWEIENRCEYGDGFAQCIKNSKKLSKSKLYGHLWCADDVDMYKVVSKEPAYMTVAFKVNEVSSNLGNGYDLVLYNSKGQKQSSLRGITSDQNWKVYVGKGTYYVAIQANSDNRYPYCKKYAVSQMSVAMKKVLPKKKVKIQAGTNWLNQALVKWDVVEGVTGYKIYRSTKKKKGFKCIRTVKGDAVDYYIDGNAKYGKTYYYKVRAYKKIGKKTYYSKYSVVKKVRK